VATNYVSLSDNDSAPDSNTQSVSGSVSVTNFPNTQPVSGTVAVSNFPATQAVSASSLPLPAGAATDAEVSALIGAVMDTQVSNDAKLDAINAKLPSGLVVTSGRLQVDVPAGASSLTNTELRASAVPVSLSSTTITNFPATQAISAASLPLATGASTSALQTTGNTSLSNIDTKTPALGQALAASSTPVVLTAAQLSALTPLTSVGVNNFPASQTVTLASTTVTNFPATQAVSIASMPTTPVTGTFFQSTQPVSVATMPSTPVTGTFWQTTQPISGTVTANTGLSQPLTDTQLRATALPITGALTDTQIRATALPVSLASTTITNFPASQAVTLASTTVTNFPATQAVSGTFFQATQPVSIASMPSTPVTGTFYQATQPVSLATAPTTPVTGTFWQATQPVSGTVAANATLTAETTKVIGTVNISAAQTLATVTTVGAVTAITNALPTGTNSIGTIQQAALTKGTQGATGVTVQNLKDAGRNTTNYFMNVPIVTTATDALQLLTGYKGGAAVAATATPAVVTAAKTYRINSISITYVAIATAGTVKFTLRALAGGVVLIGSPAVNVFVCGGPAAVAGVSQTYDFSIPDGLEFPAGTGIGVSMVGLSVTQTLAAVGYGQISIQGYEY
jgi:hypothetical protein